MTVGDTEQNIHIGAVSGKIKSPKKWLTKKRSGLSEVPITLQTTQKGKKFRFFLGLVKF